MNKTVKVLVPSIRDLKTIPPTISLVNYIASLENSEVSVFSYHSNLSSFSSDVRVLNLSKRAYPKRFFRRLMAKIRVYAHFYIYLFWHVKDIDILLIGAWDFKFLMFAKKILGFDGLIVFQYHELEFDKLKYCKLADYCIVPEENRLWIAYFLGNLSKMPLYLPNVPNIIRDEDFVAPKLFVKLRSEDKKILLYQGLVDFNKRCLLEILESIALTPPILNLVVMPSSSSRPEDLHRIGLESKRLNIVDRVHIIPSIPAPLHLNIIKLVDIGIGLYRPISLNQIYAAPNRLYEFSKYGVPQILPDFPVFNALSLKYPNAINVVDPESPNDIGRVIEKLLDDKNSREGTIQSNRFFKENGDYALNASKVWSEIITLLK